MPSSQVRSWGTHSRWGSSNGRPHCRFPEEGAGEAVPAAEVHQQAGPQEAGRKTGIEGFSGETSYMFIMADITQLRNNESCRISFI